MRPGMLDGIRVVEVADELAEYAGLLLMGLGAEVVKVEPPGGVSTRDIGPFLGDAHDRERSLHFWAYNRGKRSVAIDPGVAADRERLLHLVGAADVLLVSVGDVSDVAGTGLSLAALRERCPHLITARMSPFGDSGPWKDYKASDLVHLALGGIMMNCGYDRDPTGRYDTPPIAPQIWHAYHIAGEQLVIGVLAALLHRHDTGECQDISLAIHEAVSKNTELDVMAWVMRRAPLYRQTCRHASETPNRVPNISHTKDGRWYMTYGAGARDQARIVPFLQRYKMEADLQMPDASVDLHARNVPGSTDGGERNQHLLEVIARFVRAHRYDTMPWREAQDAGLLWAPVRKPHESALDEHWLERGSFADIEHPELGRALRYPTSKWISSETAWVTGCRAPLVGEHTVEVFQEMMAAGSTPAAPAGPVEGRRNVANVPPAQPRRTPGGKPFALQGVRILDFSWFLASAGGTRWIAALGGESLKVEWKEHPDTRLASMAPEGGREARRRATAPLKGVKDPDMGGQFNNKNAGKRGLSLNIRHPEGLEIARRLVKISDVVAEGFSPGVLDRLGLGYKALCEIRPDIIYVQQSGMGGHGKYGRFRTVGPVAASFGGATDMSGLPEPAMPAGWGYSYLDWIGAYGFAQAILGALHHRAKTGHGQWIDASQSEAGLFLTGVPVLDWSANGRVWTRYGNRSPYKPAAPHGAFPCRGEDRWIAIACFSDAHWQALCDLAGRPDWRADARFASLASRLAAQDALEVAVSDWTSTQDAADCMHRLQAAGVPAGVCQNAEDRCDHDPQLAHLQWLTEVTGTKLGTWPVVEFPAKLGATPAYSGGPIDRGAPCYGEDNAYILGELLGYRQSDIARLAAAGVI